MSEDLPDFLGGEPASETEAAPAPVQETTAPEAAPAAEGPARGPDGKFAPAAPVAEAAPATPAEPAAPHHVPLTTFLDLRDKYTTAEKKAAELQAWRDQQEAAANRQPPPDRNLDPDGWQAHQQAQFQSELYTQRLEMSRNVAELRHGPDVTKAAFDWGVQRCDQDPYFNEKIRNSRDPVGAVVAEWRREQTLARIDPSKLDAFHAWEASQAATGQAPTSAPVAPPQAPAAPRASLAAGPSAGSHAGTVPLDGEATFQQMFGS